MSIQFTRALTGRAPVISGGSSSNAVAVPGLLPAGQAQQPVQQAGRESPHQQPRHSERGADVPAGMGDLHRGSPGRAARAAAPGAPTPPRAGPRRSPATASRHHASTGVTTKPLGGRNSAGSVATTSTPAGSRPVSSTASRSAAATGPSSPGSTAPPGKATWRGWLRMSWARSIRSTSPTGPSSGAVSLAPSPGPNRIRIADSRPPSSGGRNLLSWSGCDLGRGVDQRPQPPGRLPSRALRPVTRALRGSVAT